MDNGYRGNVDFNNPESKAQWKKYVNDLYEKYYGKDAGKYDDDGMPLKQKRAIAKKNKIKKDKTKKENVDNVNKDVDNPTNPDKDKSEKERRRTPKPAGRKKKNKNSKTKTFF